LNVLVLRYLEDAAHHAGCRRWIEAVVDGDEAYGLSERVLSD